MASSQELFDNRSSWFEDPKTAFQSWLNSWAPPLQKNTKNIYTTMFSAFIGYIETKEIKFNHVNMGVIKAYLDGRELTKHHRYRYVRLLERTYQHVNGLGENIPNPGRLAAKNGVGKGSNDKTRFLDPTERERLIAAVREIAQTRDESGKDEQSNTSLRDAAQIGVMLGGGMKVSQIVALSVNCVVLDQARIDVRRSPQKTHAVLLEPWAREVLDAWLQVRAKLGLGHAVVFPPLTKRPRKPGKAPAQHQANVFTRTQKILKGLGIEGDRACPQTLRNSYAATLFDRKESIDHVYVVMGHETRYATERLQAAYLSFCNPNRAAESARTPSATEEAEEAEEAAAEEAAVVVAVAAAAAPRTQLPLDLNPPSTDHRELIHDPS